jgi:hypothetical protein
MRSLSFNTNFTVVYCDQLNFFACFRAIRLLGCKCSGTKHEIQILDAINGDIFQRALIFIMRFLGFRIAEAKFFAGYLRTLSDEAVYVSARRTASELGLKAAGEIVERSDLLALINKRWGRDSIKLYIAKTLRTQIEHKVLKILIADALARMAGQQKVKLIMQRPVQFAPNIIKHVCPAVRVYFYRYQNFSSLKSLWVKLKSRMSGRLERLRISRSVASDTNVKILPNKSLAPALLVLQEDDIALDRSYRTQPHWLFIDTNPPPFRTLILEESDVQRLPFDESKLAKHEVYFIKQSGIRSGIFTLGDSISRRLLKDLIRCILAMILSYSTRMIFAMFTVSRIILRAKALAAFCQYNNVRAFMTCENYMRDANAMNIIAPALNIKNISYQYSNLGFAPLGFTTTADVMLTFSEHYQKCFACDGIRPRAYKSIGYIFDSSFPYVRKRSMEHRRCLQKNGAKFIVCYFDESVQSDKFGIIHINDHLSEMGMLLKRVLADETFGLIIKAQFQRNSANNYKELEKLLAEVHSTGRFLELNFGFHRNVVFPAEASMTADMAIGHAGGATTSLEAALVGTRSIIINPYGIRSWNDKFYKQCNIIYPSLDAALNAIDGFRRNALEYVSLGDWSSIIRYFDPFRDGRAGIRLRNLLEHSVFHTRDCEGQAKRSIRPN